MVNIDFKDLDRGYQQISDIHSNVKTKGEALLNKIENNISNLKQHWVANDGAEHINHLVDLHKSLGDLITDAERLTSSTADNIIAVQKVRNANYNGGMVGSELSKQLPTVPTIAKVAPTERYYVDPAAANDLETLIEIYNEYSAFTEDFRTRRDELMNNWLDGSQRSAVNTAFSTFIDNSADYKGYLERAKSNLETAVSNINQIQ